MTSASLALVIKPLKEAETICEGNSFSLPAVMIQGSRSEEVSHQAAQQGSHATAANSTGTLLLLGPMPLPLL